MTIYSFAEIEAKWQRYWVENSIFVVQNNSSKPKYYVLDMFPYPSGDGLHVGHPLGYIASDIVARYKMSCGYNVLHPMGFDAFGLPAEQYAIQTGQHPAITTKKNIERYKKQLTKIGLAYDWSREVCTSDPEYYKWTQWIFSKLFDSWYDKSKNKALPIAELIIYLEAHGNNNLNAECSYDTPRITAVEWLSLSDSEKQQFLLKYRLAFLAESVVNWCPELGTVLANEEVKDGLSERGGYAVEQRPMLQWMLRITAYADRLLNDLDHLNWPEPIKAIQIHWIGRSEGANIDFLVEGEGDKHTITVFTTLPETIFGVTYIAIATDHPLLPELVKNEYKAELNNLIEEIKSYTQKNLLTDDFLIQGVFTGTYVLHPFTGERLPLWVTSYVVSGYGTGALMAVPAHDTRDFKFAKKYNLPIKMVVEESDTNTSIDEISSGVMINSDFLNSLKVKEARREIMQELEDSQKGVRLVNYRMRNSIFSRQRYWGEPIPIYYKDGVPYLIEETKLPLVLPEVASYRPTADGHPPLSNAKGWITSEGFSIETNTMPGWAGSSWYYLRYMDPNNETEFADKKSQKYWQNVDLYIGGSEHATGHLLYARFWTKFLYDLGYINIEEPFQQLINQGMIQGKSSFVYRIVGTKTYVSKDLKDNYETTPIHVSIDLVHNDKLDLNGFKAWRPDFKDAEFILNQEGEYICGSEVEKMSKSKHNIVSPDTVIQKYGADTLRLYTMFLGPLDQSKPWDTHGIDGVFRFLLKVCRLFHNEAGDICVKNDDPTVESLQILHQTIKKVHTAIDGYTFNTAVSAFMICVNELSKLKCNNFYILRDFLIILAPFAPHITEELWHKIGNTTSITYARQPDYDETYLLKSTYEYPISINGKVRVKLTFDINKSAEEIEKVILINEEINKWTQGKTPKKVIIVPQRIVNIVL
jgi:leucyl-tRNA synthetase